MARTTKLINVSNRLPISIREESGRLTYKVSPGGAAAALSIVLDDPLSIWVGWNGMNRSLSLAETKQLRMPKQLRPINMTAHQYACYYDRYSNGSLWPTLHGFQPVHVFSEEDWEVSLEVADLFADAIQSVVAPGDYIWIHDFQLIMLPAILRARGVNNPIGFFLHVPFANARLFKKLPHSKEMLTSLGQTDVCGFQTGADLRRFRALQQAHAIAQDFQPLYGVFPVGIDVNKLKRAAGSADVAHYKREVRKRFQGKTVVLSVSRLDYTKGIISQLKGFAEFMRTTQDAQRFVYVVVAAPSREGLAEYRELKRRVRSTVDAINRKYGTADWKPICYEHRNVNLDELIAFYERADIMLVAPSIDGMNLVAKEYVTLHRNGKGVLILSKTAGAAQQLKQAILIQPDRPDTIAAALHHAVLMPLDERRRCHAAMLRNVEHNTSRYWLRQFMSALVSSNSR